MTGFNSVKVRLAKRWILNRKKTGQPPQDLNKIDTRIDESKDLNCLLYYASDKNGNHVAIRINIYKDKTVESYIFLALENGSQYESLPERSIEVVEKTGENSWSIGDLKITTLEQNRRARVCFNGLLYSSNDKNSNEITDDEIKHVRFGFIFIANVMSRKRDEVWDLDLQAKFLAQYSYKPTEWSEIMNQLQFDNIDQWGSLIGEISIENLPSKDLFLHSFRQCQWQVEECNCFERYFSVTGFSISGIFFSLVVIFTKSGYKNLKLGHIRDGAENTHNMESITMKDNTLAEIDNGYNLKEFSLAFRANKINHTLKIKTKYQKICVTTIPCNYETSYSFAEMELNDTLCTGLIQYCKPYLGQNNKAEVNYFQRPLNLSINNKNNENLILSLENEKCQNEGIVGGKGASLAILKSITKSQFSVPDGFCVTSFAWQKQISHHKHLLDSINDLVKICGNADSKDLEKQCQFVVGLIESEPVIQEVKTCILKELEKFNIESLAKKRFAVRSSAIGEDSEETSAAGQNSTFLGIDNSDEVIKYISHCWASVFSYRSVMYRFQQGLPINSSIGVVVQEMVDADSAGVMFTRNPVTGNPKEIYITSNYGLGETVVSALVEPDTVIISRNFRNKCEIKESSVGKKSKKMEMKDDGGGINTVELLASEKEQISISNDVALKLADIGIEMEMQFHGPRDVEWAVCGDKIFLLQSRPITSLNNFSEVELIHELDSGVPTEIDTFTFANLGEVMATPMTPLNSKFFLILGACIDYYFTNSYNESPFKTLFFKSYWKVSANYVNLFLMYPKKKITMANRLNDIAVCGHEIINNELLEIANGRFKDMSLKDIIKLSSVTLKYYKAKHYNKAISEAQSVVINFKNKFKKNFESEFELYNEISNSFKELFSVTNIHMTMTRCSSVCEIMALTILLEGNENYSPEHYLDISLILRSCSDVISAKVPELIAKIAQTIQNSGFKDDFVNLEASEILNWIESNCTEAFAQVQEFLKLYGHRAVGEFDVYTETWGMKPEKFLSTVQQIVRLNKENADKKESETSISAENIVDHLKSPTKRKTKWLLKKIMPTCRKSVERRELTKSIMIECIHEIRLAYRKLAALLVKKCIIPEENLIFFFTHDELGIIMKNANPALIRRAYQRRKIFPKLLEFTYHENYIGRPIPKELSDLPALHQSSNTKVEGTVVYKGKVKGRACVIVKLDDAVNICSGDILITVATDIGWSPYFPLLSGVVTELGGLISHGAVVAREYGLPCLVGAVDATRFFKTGDTVFLNGDDGTICCVEENCEIRQNL